MSNPAFLDRVRLGSETVFEGLLPVEAGPVGAGPPTDPDRPPAAIHACPT